MFRKSYALNLAVLSAVIFAVFSFFPVGPGKDGIPVADNRSPEPSSALSQGSGLVQVVVRRKHSGIYYLDGTPSPTFTSFLPGTALDRRIVVVERIAYPSLAEIFVLLPDRRRINAVVVWENLVAGLAVLKADEDLPSWISLAEETSLRGELVKVFYGRGNGGISAGRIHGVNSSFGTIDVAGGNISSVSNGSPVLESGGEVVAFMSSSVYGCINKDFPRGGAVAEIGETCRRAVTAEHFCKVYGKCGDFTEVPPDKSRYADASE